MYRIHIQYAAPKKDAPSSEKLRAWAKSALKTHTRKAELTIRLVDAKEMENLNLTYRKKKGTTNVLAFPFSVPKGVDLKVPIIGDIVICSPVILKEAQEQNKVFEAHWAHMVIHGVLHLLGHDHKKSKEAQKMELLEVEILHSLGFPNPYEDGENIQDYD